MGAALCAAIRVTRASTNASPPQENGSQSHERNAADDTVGSEGRSLGFQRRAHWETMIFRLATSTLTERERKSLHARIEKLDLELAINDRLWLADQLIEPLFANRAVALGVNVNSVRRARRLSIDEHAKAHGSSSRCRSHDEMKIAGVKAVDDPPVGLVQHGGLFRSPSNLPKAPID